MAIKPINWMQRTTRSPSKPKVSALVIFKTSRHIGNMNNKRKYKIRLFYRQRGRKSRRWQSRQSAFLTSKNRFALGQQVKLNNWTVKATKSFPIQLDWRRWRSEVTTTLPTASMFLPCRIGRRRCHVFSLLPRTYHPPGSWTRSVRSDWSYSSARPISVDFSLSY